MVADVARPLRLEFPGALYHITSRGDRREAIYETNSDRESFLEILADVCDVHNWDCHAYCLMDNHYHLLIETPDGNLSRGMRQLNGVYTQWFNRNHDRVGHVFQGRYKAIHVDKDAYLLELSRYVVLNPVRAGMVRSVRDWPWSSYRATMGQSEVPPWLYVDWLLSRFGRTRLKAIEGYKRFIADGRGQPGPWGHVKNQVFLGTDEFVSTLQNRMTNESLSEIPRAQRREKPKSLEYYEARSKSRDEAVLSAYRSGGYTLSQIGDHFGLHYSWISRIVRDAKSKT